jgi:hypothetical protein
MSLINTSSFNADLLPGLVKKWFGEYKDLPTIFDRYMKVESSSQAYEIEANFTPMGALQRKDQGEVLRLDSSSEAFKPVYTNVTYALGFAITKEMIADGVAFAKAKRFVEMLKRGARITKELVSASVINNASSSSYLMSGGDGVALASASHPTRSGNQSNILSGGADLSEAAIEALNVQIMNAVDNRGLRIGLMIDKLLINPAQKADAHRILNSNLRVATSDNDANFLKDTGIVRDVIVNPYFTSTTQWQVTTVGVEDGVKLKIRQDAEMDTDNDFMTKNGLYSVDMRLVAGWSDFRGMYFSL